MLFSILLVPLFSNNFGLFSLFLLFSTLLRTISPCTFFTGSGSFITLFVGSEDKFKSVYFLFLAGASAFAMCFTPIYGARSSLYLVYFVLLVCGYVISEININKTISCLCFILFFVLICIKVPDYCYKYYLVGKAQIERLEVIKY